MTPHSKILVILALTIAGCGNSSDETGKTPDSNDSDKTDDSGNVPCVENPDFFQFLNLTINEEMATVATVTWSSVEATTDHVIFGFPNAMSMATPDELVPTTNHQVLLLGLKQSGEYAYQVVSRSSNGNFCSAVKTFGTGRLSEVLPELTLSINDPLLSVGGYTMVSFNGGGDTDIATIIDPDGNIVWAYNTQSNFVPRVRLSLDHKAILYNDIENTTINRITLDGLKATNVSFPKMHHDFVETENGSYAVLGVDIHTFTTNEGDQDFCGDTITELAADGTVREIWNIFDWFEPDPIMSYPTVLCFGDISVKEWSHANSLWYEATENAYYITFRNIDKACKIDRGTGQLLWCVGGEDSNFTSIGEDNILDYPHSVLPVDGGLLVFEFLDELAGGCSAGTMISLDFDSWTAQETWTYGTETCISNMFFGNIEPLVNSNRMLVLGPLGQIDEVTPKKETVWRINAPLGFTFAFGNHYNSLY